MSGQKVSVKTVLFTVNEKELYVYLNSNRLPTDVLKNSQDIDEVAKRLAQKCIGNGRDHYFIEQLYSFSFPDTNTLDIVYYALIPCHIFKKIPQKNWYKASTISKDDPDFDIFHYAVQRLRWKIEYTNVVYSLLPNEFTLSELQNVYEALLSKSLDKRNFRKKILGLGVLRYSGRKTSGMKARPAQIYAFKEKKMVMVKVF